jgi:putative acetyltransferase
MSERTHCRLTQTDLAMAAADGAVTRDGDVVWVRRPDNPGYYWGNYGLLPGPPEAGQIQGLVAAVRAHFADAPEVVHVHLRWDGPALSAAAAAQAKALGMSSDGCLEMVAEALYLPEPSEVVVRPLDMAEEWDQIVTLNIACDPSEPTGSEVYRLFKSRIRASWQALNRAGMATWWGAFAQGELVGQCGMIRCADGLGRFQWVETHPDHRRKGVCSTVVAAAGGHALGRGGCSAVLLSADPVGPALALYQRLGFAPGATLRGLMLGGEPMRIRTELPGDFAEVRTVVNAAFGQPEEAAAIGALRGQPGVISLVADRGGMILGHALFSPVTGEDGAGTQVEGIALAPVAVRPEQQRLGVGTALIQEGLGRCRAAGWASAFVLGDPAYYSRFGWRPATEWGLRCQWEVSPTAFQAMDLVPGGLSEWRGLVRYHPIFDDLG